MKKKELVYLYISSEKWVKQRHCFTQKEISEKLSLSLSVVHNAIKPLVRMKAIKAKQRGFELKDFEKLLVYWATIRNFEKDIVYSTFSPLQPTQIEANMPSEVIFTAYSGYKILKDSAPADYGEVYVYSDDIDEIKKRFKERKGPSNIFILKSNELIRETAIKGCAVLPLIFVDLWNLPHWYASDFLNKLKEELFS